MESEQDVQMEMTDSKESFLDDALLDKLLLESHDSPTPSIMGQLSHDMIDLTMSEPNPVSESKTQADTSVKPVLSTLTVPSKNTRFVAEHKAYKPEWSKYTNLALRHMAQYGRDVKETSVDQFMIEPTNSMYRSIRYTLLKYHDKVVDPEMYELWSSWFMLQPISAEVMCRFITSVSCVCHDKMVRCSKFKELVLTCVSRPVPIKNELILIPFTDAKWSYWSGKRVCQERWDAWATPALPLTSSNISICLLKDVRKVLLWQYQSMDARNKLRAKIRRWIRVVQNRLFFIHYVASTGVVLSHVRTIREFACGTTPCPTWCVHHTPWPYFGTFLRLACFVYFHQAFFKTLVSDTVLFQCRTSLRHIQALFVKKDATENLTIHYDPVAQFLISQSIPRIDSTTWKFYLEEPLETRHIPIQLFIFTVQHCVLIKKQHVPRAELSGRFYSAWKLACQSLDSILDSSIKQSMLVLYP